MRRGTSLTPIRESSAGRTASPNLNRTFENPQDSQHHHHHHHHHHHNDGHDPNSLQGVLEPDPQTTSALHHLTQLKKTPSSTLCGINPDIDFMTCEQLKKPEKNVSSLPAKVCLREEEIEQLIRCETRDVESAWYLTGDERKSYKKPCPKQQNAQRGVKALMRAHSPGQSRDLPPLEHPDPDDISPDVAAAMMFSQERGIQMVESPNKIIMSLFPDEEKPPIPEKSRISMADRNAKEEEEMAKKSSLVVQEGVSDSAYSRKMSKSKCPESMPTQKSFDVDYAIGHSKREYVLVGEKPLRVNKVQYRGASLPSWFPGYLTAFPDNQGLKVLSSPSKIFQKAWIHSSPKNIPKSDVFIVE